MSLYLIGSRFYRCHKADSDWDYVGEDTPENHQKCLSLGMSRVWRNKKRAQYYGKVGNRWMDVTLVPDIDVHLQARETLGEMPDMKFLSKKERTERLYKVRAYFEETCNA